MRSARWLRSAAIVLSCSYLLIAISMAVAGGPFGRKSPSGSFDAIARDHAADMIQEGRQTFRFDTFGDEEFWGGVLQLHRAIEGSALGGVGPGVSPRTALAVGLQVDVDALPPMLRERIRQGRINLDDPATTLALLRLNAVVGLTGFFEPGQTRLRAVGIQCALCHSRDDDSFAPGIGHRLDGWANRDLNVGAIIALAPNLQPVATLLHTEVDTVIKVLKSWGPGKFDAELFLDGKAFQPDGRSAATLIPSAYGLAGVNLHTWEGWGSVTHWNAFVANLEMHGQGTFFDPRLDDASQFPIAAENHFGHVTSEHDRITEKLPALHFYQLSLPAPAPPPGVFDAEAAERGDALFSGKARCASCHTDELYTEPGWNMHRGDEIGIDNFQADRGPDHRYRTAPLKGLWAHMKGGFFHDGRFATLLDVMNHYDDFFKLGLSDGEKHDLVEYVKSLSDDVPPVAIAHRSGGDGDPLGAAMSRAEPQVSIGPQPALRGQEVRISLADPSGAAWPRDLVAEVYDVAGRRITGLEPKPDGSALSFTWNGRSSDGRPVEAGIFFLRATSPSMGYTLERKIVMR